MNNWATRCNACGTSFRVTEEQLSISDGHVRCGRCDAVFDARLSLFDLDAVASAPAPLVSAPMPLQAGAAVDEALPGDEPMPATVESAQVDEMPPTFPTEPNWAADAMAGGGEQRAEPVWQEPAELKADDDDTNARLRELLKVEPEVGASAEPAVFASLRDSAPTAARAKGGSAPWNAFGGLLAGLLALALPLQWAWIEREALRARLSRVDALLIEHGYPAEGWRQLEGLSVLGSTLQATPQGKAYRLELQLHNRAPHRVAMPWLDLRLSDAAGATLMRRALSPTELSAPAVLEAGEQRRLQAVFRLEAVATAVNGYEVGLFHP